MSTTSHDTENRNAPIDWAQLTQARRRLLKAIGHTTGPKPFERPELREEVKVDEAIADFVEDKGRLLKSLNSTHLLNELCEVGYLRKLKQGGQNPIVLDLGYDEERDSFEIAPFGAAGRLQTIAFDILDRNDLPEDVLADIDLTDFNAVIDAVNQAVGRTVLVIVSDPSRYRIRDEAVSKVEERLREAADDEEEDI